MTEQPKQLPAEVWLMVFDFLGRHDITSVCGVNRAFRSIARPLLYRFATFSRLGLHFPNAVNPYPFTDLTEIGQFALPSVKLNRIASDLRRLEMRLHEMRDCNTFEMLCPEARKITVDVLWLEVVRWPEEGLFEDDMLPYPGCFVHTEYARGVDMSSAGANLRELPLDRDCLRGCGYLDAVWFSSARKVVVRGAQTQWELPEEEYDIAGAHAAAEYVLVVDSAHTWSRQPRQPTCASGPGNAPVWGFSPLPTAAQDRSIRHLTIVFWTGAPDAQWVPPCGHYTAPELKRHGGENVCAAQARLWGALVATAKNRPRLQQVTLVNTEAMAEQPAEQPVKEAGSSAAAASARERRPGRSDVAAELQRLVAGGMADVPAAERPRFEMQTLDSWIARGQWEDVFSRSEIAPFLQQPVSAL